MRQLVHAFSRLGRPRARAPRRTGALGAACVASALAAPLAALLAMLPGCASGTLADGVTDSAFIATMVELERVDRAPGLDEEARRAARAAALQGRGLTHARLEAAAAALADDPKRALEVLREIERRAAGDTATAAGRPARR